MSFAVFYWAAHVRDQVGCIRFMKAIPNDIVKDLIRYIPLLIENVDNREHNPRMENVMRRSKNIVQKLKQINDDV